ncbi:MAG: N-6 DNA methylase [Verrucomicrobiia bacterium]
MCSTSGVLADGFTLSNTGSDGDIRKDITEADLIDCLVALPGQLRTQVGKRLGLNCIKFSHKVFPERTNSLYKT